MHKSHARADNKGMKKYVKILPLTLLCLALCPISAQAGRKQTATAAQSASGSVSLSARAAALYAPQTGEFIVARNADECLPMASTTKIVTALVVLEHLPPDRVVTVPAEACGVEGSSLYLQAGEQLTVRQLLEGLMLRSANDAAEVLALETAGSIAGFAELMNQTAARLGADHTHFENPHGLDGKEHYTTARDLARLSAAAMQNDMFREIVGLRAVKMPAPEGGTRVVTNHNKLLHLYDGACGIKTGFTKKCGRCLVGAAERDGVELISVTLSAPDDWNDHKRLFDLGFSLLENRRLAQKDEAVSEVEVLGGDGLPVRLLCGEDVYRVLRRTEKVRVECDVKYPLIAPVQAGETVGEIRFYAGDEQIAAAPLLCERTINVRNKKK